MGAAIRFKKQDEAHKIIDGRQRFPLTEEQRPRLLKFIQRVLDYQESLKRALKRTWAEGPPPYQQFRAPGRCPAPRRREHRLGGTP